MVSAQFRRPYRSFLYVPADRPEMLARAAGRGADALIVDLEDAVAEQAKDQARATLTAWLDTLGPSPHPAVWVRVNNRPDRLAADVTAAAHAAIAGIVVPKAEQPETIAAIAARLPDHASVIPLVESARGVLAAAHLAAAPRVDRLALGEADLAADLGVEPSPQALEFLAVRTQIVLVSAAAGIRPPLGPVATDFTDLAAFESSTRAVHRLGFGSRSAIHPAQVAVINRVFTPTPAGAAQARRLVEAAAAFGRAGAGVFVGDDGTMVDEAIVRRARRIVELADAYGVSPEEA